MRQILLVLAGLVLLAPVAAAAKGKKAAPVAQTEEPAVDISAVKDKLQVLTDGKQHYIVVDPAGDIYQHLYYGDGRKFYGLRVSGGGRQGNEAWNRVFWEPRVGALWQGGLAMERGGTYKVQCGKRTTEVKPLEGADRDKLLAEAKFYGPLWKYRAYALARDHKGTYYYVDRPREPENNKAFRLYAGPRGSMKPLKMTNVVSDSQGDIFTTKRGELRLVLDKNRSVWFAGKKETELVSLPIEDNHIMIYTDLGVYAGQRLGTPCDDLM